MEDRFNVVGSWLGGEARGQSPYAQIPVTPFAFPARRGEESEDSAGRLCSNEAKKFKTLTSTS